MENGYWIDRKYELECSECGIVQEDNLCKWNFCPCCGADMREKRYFIKSLFGGWNEVSKERYFEYIQQIRDRCMTSNPEFLIEKMTKTEIIID